MDAVQLGSALRTIRIRLGLRQADVARRARVSSSTISRVERGHLARLTLETLLRVAASLEVRVDLIPRWRGGDLPRVLSAGHSAMHEATARLLRGSPGWDFAPEVSFGIYGERGVIDVLAFNRTAEALIVIELKTEVVDVQDLLASVDRYRRLAPTIAKDRGWRSKSVSAWVLVRDTDTNRRRVAAHSTVLRAGFPEGGRTLARWLRAPDKPILGLSFVSDLPARTVSAAAAGVRRVRTAGSAVVERANGSPRRGTTSTRAE